MDHAAFYRALRKRDSGVFGTSMTQNQVNGCEAVLAECKRAGADLGQTAYILGTAYGESAHKMQPVRENLYYTTASRICQVWPSRFPSTSSAQPYTRNPRGLANKVYNGRMGNRTGSDDGWNFRGAGIGQITGRDNFKKWSAGLSIDLTGKPELLEDLDVSVKALVSPMLEGWATGHSLPKYVKGDQRDYYNARRVWNGTFAASEFAGYAKAFETALNDAKWVTSPSKQTVSTPATGKAPSGLGIIGAFLAALAALFIKKRT